MWEGTAHCVWCHPLVAGPGIYKKAVWLNHEETVRITPLWPLYELLLPGSYLVWVPALTSLNQLQFRLYKPNKLFPLNLHLVMVYHYNSNLSYLDLWLALFFWRTINNTPRSLHCVFYIHSISAQQSLSPVCRKGHTHTHTYAFTHDALLSFSCPSPNTTLWLTHCHLHSMLKSPPLLLHLQSIGISWVTKELVNWEDFAPWYGVY